MKFMMVSNCPRCQIVRGVKLSSLHGRCQIVLFCMMVSNCPRCQIVLLAWSVSNCPRCQIVLGVKLSHHRLDYNFFQLDQQAGKLKMFGKFQQSASSSISYPCHVLYQVCVYFIPGGRLEAREKL